MRRVVLPAPVKLVAFVLASFADQDGRRIFPGNDRLAAVSGLSDRTVRRSLETLRRIGLIERTDLSGGRRGRADQYRLTMPADLLEQVELLPPSEIQAAPVTGTAGQSDHRDVPTAGQSDRCEADATASSDGPSPVTDDTAPVTDDTAPVTDDQTTGHMDRAQDHVPTTTTHAPTHQREDAPATQAATAAKFQEEPRPPATLTGGQVAASGRRESNLIHGATVDGAIGGGFAAASAISGPLDSEYQPLPAGSTPDSQRRAMEGTPGDYRAAERAALVAELVAETGWPVDHASRVVADILATAGPGPVKSVPAYVHYRIRKDRRRYAPTSVPAAFRPAATSPAPCVECGWDRCEADELNGSLLCQGCAVAGVPEPERLTAQTGPKAIRASLSEAKAKVSA